MVVQCLDRSGSRTRITAPGCGVGDSGSLAIRHQESKMAVLSSKTENDFMWHDNETTQDLLGFEALAESCVNVLRNDRLLPVTVGLFGDWGSGKSSLMTMIEKSLSTDKNILCVRFNSWTFEGYDDLRAALMEEIYDALKSELTNPEKAKNLLDRLRRRIDWFRVAGLTVRGVMAISSGGLGEAGSVTSISDLAPLWKSGVDKDEAPQDTVRGFRTDFEELIDKASVRTLVVFIDDLDRCLPPRIIDTLEAVRLFLSIPHTAFVIAASETVIQKAVETRYPEYEVEKEEIGQQYLEKLVQIPFRIPRLSPTETQTYMNLLFAQQALGVPEYERLVTHCRSARGDARLNVSMNIGVARSILGAVPPQLDQSFGLSERIAPVICSGLKGNPRQIKRFLNTLLIRVEMAERLGLELRMDVLAKLMLVEYFHKSEFKDLFRWQQRIDGAMPEIAAIEQGHTDKIPGDASKKWVDDPELKRWRSLEPMLKDVDLRPYFYVTRESLTERVSAAKRLTVDEQELLADLSSESDSYRKKGVEKLMALSPDRSAAVIDVAAEKLQSLDDKSALAGSLLDAALGQPTLAPRVLDVLAKCPTSGIGLSIPVKLQRLAEKQPDRRPAVLTLLRDWENRSTGPLQKSTKRVIEQLTTTKAP